MVRSIDEAVDLVTTICLLPANADLEARATLAADAGVLRAMVASRDTAALFGWLMDSFSYQGISDRIVAAYIGRHGNATQSQIGRALDDWGCDCPKLQGHSDYTSCGFRKSAFTCANPEKVRGCPVPALPLRKGDLNQLAFSLFFFVRDRCENDIVGYIDRLFQGVEATMEPDPVAARREILVAAFSEVHAVSAKLINMTFAGLLISGDPMRPDWVDVGRSMVAIDSLVHNFLVRTGILSAVGTTHAYGPACYRPGGCASVIYGLTDRIGASKRWRNRPAPFPRLVQLALWSFCAEAQMDVCNGRWIDDLHPCRRTSCPVGSQCSRAPLRLAQSMKT